MSNRFMDHQILINTQLSEDLAALKTQQLFFGQALGSVVELLEGLLDRLGEREILAPDDELVLEFRRGVETVREMGLRLDAPIDPNAAVCQVKCPQCDAVIKVQAGQRVERCDWCGHRFSG